MASRMIGRCTCPWCGFGSAHVKESDKCAYMFCPECGSQHYARTERQRADLMAKTRPETSRAVPATEAPPAPARDDPATPTATDATPTGSEPPAPKTPPAPAKRPRLFG